MKELNCTCAEKSCFYFVDGETDGSLEGEFDWNGIDVFDLEGCTSVELQAIACSEKKLLESKQIFFFFFGKYSNTLTIPTLIS